MDVTRLLGTGLLAGTIAFVVAVRVPVRAQSFSPWATPQNLGPVVNSAADDMHPAISPDGLSLYFSSDRDGGSGSFDLWVSHRPAKDDPWEPSKNLGSALNTGAAETAPAFDPSGHFLFFGSERDGGCGGRDLWMSFRRDKKDDFGWDPPVNLGCAVNSAAFDDGPTYFEEDNGLGTLYFISGRAGGLGKRDVWAATRNPDGSLNPPMNISELNSPADDARPAISRSGLEFFFTSLRVGSILNASGSPSSDLWASVRETTTSTWSTPINLGSLNTSAADAAPAISKDGTVLYFNSNRSGGSGGQDLYVTVRTKH